MRISIKQSNKKGFTILFPSCFIFNPLVSSCAARFINYKLGKNDEESLIISAKALRQLSRSIMKYKRKNRDWILVDVKSANKDRVIIKL